jgi:hypothetical protein
LTFLYLDLHDDANEEETCENCNLTKPKNQILIHIGKTKACKTHYGPRFKAMKAQNERERKQKSRARIGKEKVNEQQRQAYAKNSQKKKSYYQENQETLIKKSRERYHENQETLSKKAREKAQEKKRDSDANLSKFYKDIEFGPEFICICCHANLFEKEVHEFTDEKENSIAKKLYDDSCESKAEFSDPRGEGRKFICRTCFS